jgi:enoyl-[acyl-carrier-protein] reductase (NADH)
MPGPVPLVVGFTFSDLALPDSRRLAAGMSSAKAQLESDTKVLAWEAGRKYGVRVNTISAGPLASRAAIAIKKVRAAARGSIQPSVCRARTRASTEQSGRGHRGSVFPGSR